MLKEEIKAQIKIAKELCYPIEIIERLSQATSHTQIVNIMIDGRHKMLDKSKLKSD